MVRSTLHIKSYQLCPFPDLSRCECQFTGITYTCSQSWEERGRARAHIKAFTRSVRATISPTPWIHVSDALDTAILIRKLFTQRLFIGKAKCPHPQSRSPRSSQQNLPSHILVATVHHPLSFESTQVPFNLIFRTHILDCALLEKGHAFLSVEETLQPQNRLFLLQHGLPLGPAINITEYKHCRRYLGSH